MPRAYVPEAGDIVWLNFTPQAGHRPALVLSPRAYNEKTNLMVCCPMTTQIKNYPFEVQIASTTPSSVVLADQIKSLDWRVRQAEFICALPAETVAEVLAKLATLLSDPV